MNEFSCGYIWAVERDQRRVSSAVSMNLGPNQHLCDKPDDHAPGDHRCSCGETLRTPAEALPREGGEEPGRVGEAGPG